MRSNLDARALIASLVVVLAVAVAPASAQAADAELRAAGSDALDLTQASNATADLTFTLILRDFVCVRDTYAQVELRAEGDGLTATLNASVLRLFIPSGMHAALETSAEATVLVEVAHEGDDAADAEAGSQAGNGTASRDDEDDEDDDDDNDFRRGEDDDADSRRLHVTGTFPGGIPSGCGRGSTFAAATGVHVIDVRVPAAGEDDEDDDAIRGDDDEDEDDEDEVPHRPWTPPPRDSNASSAPPPGDDSGGSRGIGLFVLLGGIAVAGATMGVLSWRKGRDDEL